MGERQACLAAFFEPLTRYPRPTRRTKGAVMFLAAIRLSLSAAALAAAVSTSAFAGPLPLFPFEPPPYQPPRATAYAPAETEAPAVEQQAQSRFKRQVVSYPTHEAPGTIVIDTPNTYLYLVLGNGQALRYGIGVGREGDWKSTRLNS